MAGAAQTRNEEQLRQLMPPPPPRPPASLSHVQLAGDKGIPKAVLPEEDYTEGIAAIIERDYFPDIPKLRNQLEWAQAVKSGDPALIRQAQVNIARRRAGLITPHVQSGAVQGNATPGEWGSTPATVARMKTPAMTPLPGTHVPLLAPTPAASSFGAATPAIHTPGLHAAQAPISQPVEELRAPPMSLDTFLSTHTSEDNASFAKIHAKDILKKRQKVVHHLEDKNKPLLLEGPGTNPQEEYGTSGQQPMTLVFTRHNPTNALYYPPDQKPLSAKEAEAQSLRPGKAINARATRIKQVAAEPTQQQGTSQAGQGTEGNQTVKQWGPAGVADKDYNRLGTPAFTPGMMGQSPLMTWGDIASTPLRLELEDPGVVLDENALKGPAFEVPSMPKREQLGHELAAAKSIREMRKRQQDAREAAAIAAALPPGAAAALTSVGKSTPSHKAWSMTPTPGRAGLGASTPSLTPKRDANAAGLSLAAHKLVKSLKVQQTRAKTGSRTPSGSDLDRMLRASYSAKPAAGGMTPTMKVAKSSNTQRPVSEKPLSAADKVAGSKAASDSCQTKNITDDLLHI